MDYASFSGGSWSKLLADIDENKNGKIDIKEFKNLMLTQLYPEN